MRWVIASIAFLSFGCSSSFEPSEYLSHVQSTDYEANYQLIPEVATIAYRTATYFFLQDASSKDVGLIDYQKGIQDYNGLVYFQLTMNDQSDVKPAVMDEMGHYRLEKKLEQSITLIHNQDTLSPVLFHPERYFGLRPDIYLIGFSRPSSIDDMVFVLNKDGKRYEQVFDESTLYEPEIRWKDES